MPIDYREPRNGDFASYVENLSRRFDLKDNTSNPDFSPGFAAQAIARDGASPAPGAAGQPRKRGTATAANANARPQNRRAEATNAAATAQTSDAKTQRTRPFPIGIVMAVIAVVMFILADSYDSTNGGFRDWHFNPSLIITLIVVFFIVRRILGAIKYLFNSDKVKKQP